jgi:hypothetical protein
MWNQLSCKNQNKEIEIHLENRRMNQMIHNVKAKTDTSSPKCLKFNLHRPFGTSSKESFRKKQIFRENQVLLKKMLRIDLKLKRKPTNFNEEVSTIKSLNKKRREKSQKSIKRSNKDLLQRVRSVEPVYSTAEWKDFNKFHNYIRDNISRNSGRHSKAKQVETEKKSEGFSDDFLDKLYELNSIKLK